MLRQKRFRSLGFSSTSIKPLTQHPILVCQIKAVITRRSSKTKSWRERTDSFSPSHMCFFCIWKLYRNNFAVVFTLNLLVSLRRLKKFESKSVKSLHHTIEHQSTNSPDRQDAERKNLCAEAGSKFCLTSQKNPKCKGAFDIAGRVLSETAVIIH